MAESKKPLTRSQWLVWLGQQQAPNVPLYNMAISFDIPTSLDVGLFRRAFRDLVADCDSLRTVFAEHLGQPYRRVLAQIDFDFPHIDFSLQHDPESACQTWIKQRQILPLDLAHRTFDTALLQLSATHFFWYLNQHHIITDGRSVSLIFEAVAARYQARCDKPQYDHTPCEHTLYEQAHDPVDASVTRGSAEENAPLPPFEDYAAYEQRLQTEGRTERSKHYWQQQAQQWQVLDRACFYGHTQSHATTACDRFLVDIGPARTKSLRNLAASQQFGALSAEVALFQMLLTLLFASLYRITGQSVLVVGAPSANRANVRQRNTVGLLMQLFSLRVEIEPNDSFQTLHHKVQTESLNYLRHAVPGAASPESARAFNQVLNYTKVSALHLGEVTVQQRFHHAGHGEAHHLLRLQVQDFEDSGELLLQLDLNRSAFSHVTKANTVEHFISTLDVFLNNPDAGLDEYELLSCCERTWLKEYNHNTAEYRQQRPLNELFEAVVVVHPQRLALVSEQIMLSYFDLDRRANQLALTLLQSGVGHGSVVGLNLPRSSEQIIAMLAVLKVGAAYMPIDVDTPAARRDSLLDLAEAAAVISTKTITEVTEDDKQRTTPTNGRIWLNVNALEGPASDRSFISAANNATIDSPAYVLFTSGSTGEPKGVVCTHRGVLNLLEDFEQRNPLTDDIHCAWWTSASFDVSVYEIYSALTQGRTLHIVPEHARADGRRFFQWLCTQQIQSAYAPPFMLNEMRTLLEDGHRAPPLERLLVGVEPITEQTLAAIRSAMPKLQIINGYGPTEATICTSLYNLPQGAAHERNTPIGRPVKNSSLYLLDQSLQLVAPGAVGEIYIGGHGLACGYLNRPDLTAASFVNNPFDLNPEARLYKTGDQAYFLPDGNLMFLGRVDDQIKLRGLRIEPGEVERALVENPRVRDALVMALNKDKNKQQQGDKELIAYIVPLPDSKAPRDDWSHWLGTRLPRFMIPSAYVELKAFPLTASGKIDRNRLPAPRYIAPSPTPVRAPTSPLEHTLAKIFSKVLALAEIDIDAHFLELGGDSIQAMLIAANACESGLQLAPRQIFETGSIAALAEVLENAQEPPETIRAILKQQESDQPNSVQPSLSKAGFLQPRATKSVSVLEMEQVLAEFGEDPYA
ncbi:MAG: amino acid adenylation domain-containing protein [Motiliproteus sp.]